MKKNWWKYLIVFILALALSVIAAPIRQFGFPISTLVYFGLYLLFSLCFLKKFEGKLPASAIILATVSGAILLDLPFRITGDHSVMMSLPEFIFRILAPLVAWAVWVVRSRITKIVILGLGLAICCWVSIYGYNYWHQKVNFGTYTGRIYRDQSNTLSFQTHLGDTITLAQLGGRYVVLDFFTSDCGYCFAAMPKVQALYDEHKNADKVKVCGVHWRLENRGETFAKGSELTVEMKYTFPCLSTDRSDSTLQKFIQRVPTVLIFDQQTNQFIFCGTIANATTWLNDLL